MKRIVAAILASVAVTPAAAADGEQLFNKQCKACHAGGPMGPSLTGVAGRRIAAKQGFAYSAALRAKGGSWTDANLDAFLAAPARFAPGSKMLTTVASPQDRRAIIAHQKQMK